MEYPNSGRDGDVREPLLAGDTSAPSSSGRQRSLIEYSPFSLEAFVQYVVKRWRDLVAALQEVSRRVVGWVAGPAPVQLSRQQRTHYEVRTQAPCWARQKHNNTLYVNIIPSCGRIAGPVAAKRCSLACVVGRAPCFVSCVSARLSLPNIVSGCLAGSTRAGINHL